MSLSKDACCTIASTCNSLVLRTRRKKGVFTLTPRARTGSSTTQSSSPVVGTLIQDLQVLDKIGEGSYGSVYRALDLSTGEGVAVKEILTNGEQGTGFPDDFRIELEATIQASLSHCPSIATFFKHLQNANSQWIATEFCSGGDLSNYVKNETPLTEQQLAAVARSALDTLNTCHSNGVLHGDIKASNFVIRSSMDLQFFNSCPERLTRGWLKGIDFGCSMRMGAFEYVFRPFWDGCLCLGRGKCTNKVGTPTHWPPEVFGVRFGLEADLWSLGTMLYQLLTLRLPFFTKQEERRLKTEREILLGIITKKPDFASPLWEDVSDDCKDFLIRLLQRDASRRMNAEEAAQHPFLQ